MCKTYYPQQSGYTNTSTFFLYIYSKKEITLAPSLISVKTRQVLKYAENNPIGF